MTGIPEVGNATGNSFLDALTSATKTRLFPQLTSTSLRKGLVVGQPGVPADAVYFPVRSMISTLTQMADGSAVEVGIAGHEGLSSLALTFGKRVSPHTTIVQISNSSYSMPAEAFLTAVNGDRDLYDRCHAFAEYSFIAATQFAACNRLHPVEERYARWLLMADDRVGGGEFMLTQDFTAEMLGVRRASVTVVAGMLSTAGLISYRRGHLQVRDPEGLRNTTCECYDAINDELNRLMGYRARIPGVLTRAE